MLFSYHIYTFNHVKIKHIEMTTKNMRAPTETHETFHANVLFYNDQTNVNLVSKEASSMIVIGIC